MFSMPVDLPTSGLEDSDSTGRRVIEHRIDEYHQFAAHHPIGLPQDIGTTVQYVRVAGGSTILCQSLGYVTTNAVISRQRATQTKYECRSHRVANSAKGPVNGRLIVNVVPTPTALSTAIVPPCFVTMP